MTKIQEKYHQELEKEGTVPSYQALKHLSGFAYCMDRIRFSVIRTIAYPNGVQSLLNRINDVVLNEVAEHSYRACLGRSGRTIATCNPSENPPGNENSAAERGLPIAAQELLNCLTSNRGPRNSSWQKADVSRCFEPRDSMIWLVFTPILRENTMGMVRGFPALFLFHQPHREFAAGWLFRVFPFRNGTIHLHATIPSPGFEHMPYNT
ncbi:hypothetical protein TNCV_2666161 [Trichonephila clavipes]|nr:hypothetical protein TNCV_2666161 [Trichonephila clavipes]